MVRPLEPQGSGGNFVSNDNTKGDPTKKHRHDIGAVDHGPGSTEATTRAIQVLLAICIVLSVALTMYALAHIGLGVSAS